MRLATICAREGSKGVPGKNKRFIDGLPLFAHSIIQAKESGIFDHIVISTDDHEIMESASRYGAILKVPRPAELALDASGKPEVIAHATKVAESELGVEFDIVVDLDVTSPLRNLDDIRGAVRLLEETGCSSVITGTIARRNPYFNLVELDANQIARISKSVTPPLLSRQMAPKCYDMNAAVHVFRRNQFLKNPVVFYDDTRLFEMPEERSHDIDTEFDFFLVECIMKARRDRNVASE